MVLTSHYPQHLEAMEDRTEGGFGGLHVWDRSFSSSLWQI